MPHTHPNFDTWNPPAIKSVQYESVKMGRRVVTTCVLYDLSGEILGKGAAICLPKERSTYLGRDIAYGRAKKNYWCILQGKCPQIRRTIEQVVRDTEITYGNALNQPL